jgi:hypothetical protein
MASLKLKADCFSQIADQFNNGILKRKNDCFNKLAVIARRIQQENHARSSIGNLNLLVLYGSF